MGVRNYVLKYHPVVLLCSLSTRVILGLSCGALPPPPREMLPDPCSGRAGAGTHLQGPLSGLCSAAASARVSLGLGRLPLPLPLGLTGAVCTVLILGEWFPGEGVLG